jgi:hypothetical protein
MSSQLIFSSKGLKTFCLATFVWADVMGLREMLLQTRIILVINVFVVIRAQVASEIVFTQVFVKLNIIEEELFTEIVVRMWQDLRILIVSKIAHFDMGT